MQQQYDELESNLEVMKTELKYAQDVSKTSLVFFSCFVLEVAYCDRGLECFSLFGSCNYGLYSEDCNALSCMYSH